MSDKGSLLIYMMPILMFVGVLLFGPLISFTPSDNHLFSILLPTSIEAQSALRTIFFYIFPSVVIFFAKYGMLLAPRARNQVVATLVAEGAVLGLLDYFFYDDVLDFLSHII